MQIKHMARTFFGLYLVMIFLSAAVPAVLLPFVKVLPYLQPWPLGGRVIGATFAYVVAIAMWRLLGSQSERKSTINAIGPGLLDKLGLAVGFGIFICLSGALNANSFGLLAKLSPGTAFTESYLVVSSKNRGSRYKSTDLDLLSTQNRDLHYLTLSAKLFNIPPIPVGSTIRLEGKETIFGKYIDGFGVIAGADLKR